MEAVMNTRKRKEETQEKGRKRGKEEKKGGERYEKPPHASWYTVLCNPYKDYYEHCHEFSWIHPERFFKEFLKILKNFRKLIIDFNQQTLDVRYFFLLFIFVSFSLSLFFLIYHRPDCITSWLCSLGQII